MGAEYVKKYEIRTYDFNEFLQLRAETIMNFLQDISTMHYQEMVRLNAEIDPDGLWVIVDWDVTIHHFPVKVQTLNVLTEPIYFRKFIAYRRYEITNEAGDVIVEAMSKWAYISKEQRRQISIPNEIYRAFDVSPTAIKPKKMVFSEETKHWLAQMHHHSKYSDIDVNGHVNNVAYFRWMIDAIPRDIIENLRPYHIKIQYKKEVFQWEDVNIDVWASKSFNEHQHGTPYLTKISITHHEDVCVVGEIAWR